MKTRFAIVAALSFSVLSGVCAPAHAAQPAKSDDAGAAYKRLMTSVGPALVTLKFVMKFEGAGSERFGEAGRDVEYTALMMEPGGLVLVSNAKMGGLSARSGMAANPTNIRVLIGDDTEGLKGKILARDTDLDLCWVQIDDEKAKGKTFEFVDFASGAPAEVGDRLFMVDRMGKFFDHALSVNEGRVGGKTRKPRALLVPTGFPGGPGQLLGSPMFNADGKVVGVNIVQLPDKEDVEGGESGGEGNSGVLLLPASEVIKATARGKEMAAKAPKEEPKPEPKKDDKPADAKKDDSKKDDSKKDEPKKP